jgi:hypothetical protein
VRSMQLPSFTVGATMVLQARGPSITIAISQHSCWTLTGTTLKRYVGSWERLSTGRPPALSALDVVLAFPLAYSVDRVNAAEWSFDWGYDRQVKGSCND